MYKLDEAGEQTAKEYVQKWTDNAFKTGVMTPEERKHCVEQVHKLYENAGLERPIVVIAPSPFVARFATGAACAHYYIKDQKDDDAVAATDAATSVATFGATLDATLGATDDATSGATLGATSGATFDATSVATFDATDAATSAATFGATDAATSVATLGATLDATDAATSVATFGATLDATFDATFGATDDATDDATDAATFGATLDATRSATFVATFVATRSATRSATFVATDITAHGAAKLPSSETYKGSKGCIAAVMQSADKFGLLCAKDASKLCQGGNTLCYSACFIEFGREHCKLDELGLVDKSLYEKYQPWEELAKISGFRYVHEKFCIVSDRPIKYNFDENNELHCEDGPAVEWSDGTAIHAWHGIHVPWKWIEDKDNLNPEEVLSTENVEQRAAGIQILGIQNLLDKLDHKVVDYDEDPSHGELIEVKIPGLPDPVQYLKAECPRNGIIMEGVPMISDIDDKPIKTVRAAQAWGIGLAESEFEYPSIRT